jgi:translocation and assembly module TamB
LTMEGVVASEAEAADTVLQESTTFSWPEWIVEVGSIQFENNRIAYFTSNDPQPNSGFDPDALVIEQFDLGAHSIFLKDQRAGAVVDHVRLRERSGFELQEVYIKLAADDQQLNVSDFHVRTSGSALDAQLTINYPSLAELIGDPMSAGFDMRLLGMETNLSDALYFSPELNQMDYFGELQRNGLTASGDISGNIDEIDIQNLTVNYGKNTALVAKYAKVKNPTDLERLYVNIPAIVFSSQRNSLQPLVADLGYQLPESLRLELSATGSMKDMLAKVDLTTPDGIMGLDAKIRKDSIYRFETRLGLVDLQVGKFLDLPQLAPVTMYADLMGIGSNLDNLNANLAIRFDQLEWDDYDYSPLRIDLDAEDKLAKIRAGFVDTNLDFELFVDASLDTLNPEYNIHLDLNRLRTRNLGFTAQDIVARMKVDGSLVGEFDDFKTVVSIEEGSLFLEGASYPIGRVALQAELAPEMASMKISSDFLNGSFISNASLEDLTASIQQYFARLVEEQEIDSGTGKPLIAKANFIFYPTPVIDQLLINQLDELDTVSLDFEYLSNPANLSGRLFIPEAKYGGVEIDTLLVSFLGDEQHVDFQFGFRSLLAGPVDMNNTRFTGVFENKELDITFNSGDGDRRLINLESRFRWDSDSIFMHVFPDNLVLNGQRWDIPESNRLIYYPGILEVRDFNLSRNNQRVLLSSDFETVAAEHFGISFENFNLITLTEFINPESPILRGVINGDFVVENPFGAIGLDADLNIQNMELMDIPLGTLALLAEAKTLNEYDFLLTLKEGDIDADLGGSFLADSVSSNLDLNLNIKSLQSAMMEKIAGDVIGDTRGYLSGSIKVNGTVQEPDYNGELRFHDAAFLIRDLNTRFAFPDEVIRINNDAIVFRDFSIRDENSNNFQVNGRIITEDITDINLDLRMRGENFQVLNSTREDNDLFFGKANINMNMDITGNVFLPDINVRLRVNKGTDMTFIVPEDQLELIERTGVVLMVNHQDPFDIMYKRNGETESTGIQGFDVRAQLLIDPQAIFNVIVDERTGDNLRIQGEADLNMLMDPNGNISLSGKYEVKSGHYELNLFGLVNRRFELAEGSTVNWNGDPMDASLDFTAIYNVKTSPGELMQAQVSGTDTETRTQYRQALPFLVYLNIEGELIRPVISFELDMPEQERGALGGSVYSMIQQVNEQEDEVTKQVFSLLVLNQFFPMLGNDGSSGGTVNIARSSVSQLLSTQMNALSDRLFGGSGFSVDFDLDSYTAFESGAAEDRTQLNVAARQRLMDDRMIISVGGQVDVEGSPNQQQPNQGDNLFGDVSIEYLIDTEGQWRARAYRRNTFESVIDGQLIVTGLAFIFNKEFNAFRELWRGAAVRRLERRESRENRDSDDLDDPDINPLPKEEE